MRVVFCGADISGYAAACWRELAHLTGLDVTFLARYSGPRKDSSFGKDLVSDIPCCLLSDEEISNVGNVIQKVVDFHPDVVFISGWCFKSYRVLPKVKALKKCKFILGMDTPRKNSLRQVAGRIFLHDYIRQMDAVLVPGERCWQYARFLGVDERRIYRGGYGFDEGLFGPCYEQRIARGWPKKFLFVGRYTPVKGLGVLITAYRRYRHSVSDPWELTCCGKGEEACILKNEPGVVDRGFVVPEHQPAVFAEHGVFILPSRYEPWGVVINEACAAGLPVICTNVCGSAVELIRPYYNGLMCKSDDVNSLTKYMLWMHSHYEELPAMGARSVDLAAPYSSKQWAKRFQMMLEDVDSNE